VRRFTRIVDLFSVVEGSGPWRGTASQAAEKVGRADPSRAEEHVWEPNLVLASGICWRKIQRRRRGSV